MVTLGPSNIRALEIFLGYASPCLMDLFTPKILSRCLNSFWSCGAQPVCVVTCAESSDAFCCANVEEDICDMHAPEDCFAVMVCDHS
jgi:hypothetical protein